MKKTVFVVVLASLFVGLLSLFASGPADYVWWEAEYPESGELKPCGPYAPANDQERSILSGGDWLTWDDRTPGTPGAVYAVTVPADGNYELWVRKFGDHGAFEWRFDNGPWQPYPSGRPMRDSIPLDITANGRYMTANWLKLGDARPGKGPHRFAIRMTAGQTPLAGIDCFVLHAGPFHPRGKLKPDEPFEPAPRGWFNFAPPPDPLSASPMDMSGLDPGPAGAKGRVARRGDKLVFEKTGEEVRFWGVTACEAAWNLPRPQIDQLARRLAKMGVNMVRLHAGPFYETTPGPQTDNIHYFVAALKKNGIYSGLNWYCLAVDRVQPSWKLEGFQTGDAPFALHLFYPPMLELYRSWARTLIGTKNPYTGLSLAHDPAVAYIELVDEDNYFFWTFDPARINPVALPFLERKFGAWLTKRYGSPDKALAAWGDEGPAPKQPSLTGQGRVSLYPAGLLGGTDWMVKQRNSKRASDQVRFMTEDEAAFDVGMKRWLKSETGYKGLMVATTWTQSDPRVLGPLDYYANQTLDITARNTYFSAPHRREKFFPWTVGDLYQDMSLLRNPVQAIATHMQYAGHPHFITEGGYTMPNRFRTEEPLLMAAYGSLQGIAGMFPFQLDPSDDWNLIPTAWPIQTPVTMGQYPAASLIFRRGYVHEGPVVVNEALKLEDLYRFKGGAELPKSFDTYRASDYGPQASRDEVPPTIDPLAFFVGRAVQTIGGDPGKTKSMPQLSARIDRGRKIVHSATGELTLDYGRGLLVIDAAKAQGAAGFLGGLGGPVRTADATFDVRNEYAAIVLVSLDDKPLAKSSRMLLQVMTEEKAAGWQTEPARGKLGGAGPEVEAEKITRIGGPPMLVRNIEGSVSINRADASKLRVTELDLNGYPVKQSGPAGSIRLSPDACYYVIEKR